MHNVDVTDEQACHAFCIDVVRSQFYPNPNPDPNPGLYPLPKSKPVTFHPSTLTLYPSPFILTLS